MRPLLLYDGDCGFCRGWIRRWRLALGERVEMRPFQEAAAEHPELPLEELRRAVHYVDAEGRVHRGAEAVFRALANEPSKRWMLSCYERVPGWRWAAERCYALVARHRGIASRLQGWLVGPDPVPAEHFLVRRAFGIALAAVYAIAFGSLWPQVDGLFGSRGIAPVADWLARARESLGGSDWLLVPTVFWLDAGDRALHGACAAGLALAGLAAAGIAPRLCFALLWALYLSFVSVGNVFLGYQWDALLLESGLYAVLFAPGGLRPGLRATPPPPRVVLWLLRWLVFRLMFLSGASKLASGDPTWADLTALEYHYWSQPLPHALSYWAHQLPGWLQRASAAAMFAIELGAPFLILGPRRLRCAATAAFAALLLLIMATGNYGFFEPLSLALCIPLLDDRALVSLVPRRWRPAEAAPATRASGSAPRAGALWAFALLALLLTGIASARRLGRLERLPRPLAVLSESFAPFASFNAYGLFAVMTTERLEIELEGSRDGTTWLAYAFRYKPGPVERRPGFAGVHMPRLDWQMWFAALGNWRENPWYLAFVERLLAGSPAVAGLLERDPFGGSPPLRIRSKLARYRFATLADHRSGAWWTREPIGEYCPVLELDEQGRLRAVNP
jgi:predicted DCC family thiol-disulfide oxidoreductase YuxK